MFNFGIRYKLIEIIGVATNALEYFKGSTIEEKRQILNLVLSNLELIGGKVYPTIRFPFSEITKINKMALTPLIAADPDSEK